MNFLFVVVCLETGSHCVVLAVLEFTEISLGLKVSATISAAPISHWKIKSNSIVYLSLTSSFFSGAVTKCPDKSTAGKGVSYSSA